MKCIKCGQELKANWNENVLCVGYTCINSNCEIYNQSWSIATHKDNQNWAVRHIRALETQIKELQEALLLLQQKVTG